MIIGHIPSRDLGDCWADLWPLLEPAVKRSPDEKARDVLGEIRAGRAHLWGIYDGEQPVGAVVTVLQPDHRVLLWLVGGKRLREWAGLFMRTLTDTARFWGCMAIWGTGRRGWQRIVPLFGGHHIEDFNGGPAWEKRI